MAATLVTGLVIEAIQKMASAFSGVVLARSRKPAARRYTTLPLRAIAATAPEKAPASTCVCCQAAIRASRDDENSSASGSLTGAASNANARHMANTATRTTTTGDVRPQSDFGTLREMRLSIRSSPCAAKALPSTMTRFHGLQSSAAFPHDA